MPDLRLETVRAAYRFVKDDLVYGTLLYRYGVARHRALQRTAVRTQRHTYTCFHRSPGQLEALAGPVMSWLLDERPPGPLRVLVFACSNGAEPYTIACVLAHAHPTLTVQITASDRDAEMLAHARTGEYTVQHVERRRPPAWFVNTAFERGEDSYRVRDELRRCVQFEQADLLDPAVVEHFAAADLVFAQNVMCHLEPAQARQAFAHVTALMKPRAALFIDGMDLALREELTRASGLVPLEFKAREIHDYARTHIADRWWNYYYGIEPYARWHPHRAHRFSTIFLRTARQV